MRRALRHLCECDLLTPFPKYQRHTSLFWFYPSEKTCDAAPGTSAQSALRHIEQLLSICSGELVFLR